MLGYPVRHCDVLCIMSAPSFRFRSDRLSMIDVFSHFVPPAVLARFVDLKPELPALSAFGRLPELWDIDARLRSLDPFPGVQQILNFGNPPSRPSERPWLPPSRPGSPTRRWRSFAPAIRTGSRRSPQCYRCRTSTWPWPNSTMRTRSSERVASRSTPMCWELRSADRSTAHLPADGATRPAGPGPSIPDRRHGRLPNRIRFAGRAAGSPSAGPTKRAPSQHAWSIPVSSATSPTSRSSCTTSAE